MSRHRRQGTTMLVRSLILATCLIAAPATAQQASFDCAKARTPVEKAICDTPYAAELDRAMDELYRAVLAKGPRAPTEAAQRKWLAARDARCGRAKVDPDCLARHYKQRIVELARPARPATAPGAFITGRYAYREKAQAGEMFLAEMPDGRTLAIIDTVNVGHISPHTCSFAQRSAERRGDVLLFRDAEASKTCGLEIAVSGNRAVMREVPKDCFELAQYNCGAHGYMLGNYVRQ